MSNKDTPTWIANNFGPVNGNVEQQQIYVAPQPNAHDHQAAPPCREAGNTQESATPGQATERTEKGHDEKLSIGELIILFESVLDISLDANYTNQSALAALISAVSGYKRDSIRQKIQDGIDYDKPKVKAGARKIAALFENVKPKISERLKNNIE